ncbi:hypothetical protein M2651_05725 [Clostridium sp. SYSU_GA19001]|uniref:hypothetical protein n=1 Tax=Clostridium caldaquaticum TaxID=2940653 RepID=UPI0020777666|nr:hypothetical protein [Clostridium caldaquaticum]MCM8710524.1 hypothetical protein [Clostridium caldaquaticum]
MQDLTNEINTARKQLNECLVFYKNTGRQLAEAEMKYRIALRKEFLRLHLEDGVAWTACSELARGQEEVAQLRFRRDVKKSDYECCYEKILQLKTELRILENEIEAERKGL